MKRSKIVSVFLLGTLAGCWDSNPDDEQIVKEEVRATLAKECTIEADSDVDCIPPDGGHSEGTQQAYHAGGGGGGNNAFLWYWLGTQNSRTVYVAPPAAYSPPPAPSVARAAPAYSPSPALSARGGFGGGGAAHGASGGGG